MTDDEGKIKEVRWVELDKLDNYEIKPKKIVEMIKSFSNSKNLGLSYSVDFKK